MHLSLALLAAILEAMPGAAQTGARQEKPRLGEADDRTQEASAPVLTRYDVIVVTATRTETTALELPVSVAVARREDVEQIQFNSPSVGEIVRDLPGVSVGHGNRNISAVDPSARHGLLHRADAVHGG